MPQRKAQMPKSTWALAQQAPPSSGVNLGEAEFPQGGSADW